jgi:membrane protein DedA with SNARE-associated domain
VRRYGRYFLVHERDLDRAEESLRRRRGWALFITRVVPVVRTYAGFGAGVLRFPVPTFLAVTYAGSFVWCLPFVALGAMLGENWDVIEGPAKLVGASVVASLLVILAFATLRQLRRSQAG